MNKYKVNNKIIQAKSISEAITLYDEVSLQESLEALIADEISAIASYDVAIKSLIKRLPEISIKALIAIRDDERRHIQNLYAILNNEVTEKNLQDEVPEIVKLQRRVDYDMVRFGKINSELEEELESSGLTLVKNRYDYYEVVPKE